MKSRDYYMLLGHQTSRWILEKIKPGESLEYQVARGSLRYFGHVCRAVGSLERDILFGKVEGQRRRGRPLYSVDGQGAGGTRRTASGYRLLCGGRQRGANGGRLSSGAPVVDHNSMVQGNKVTLNTSK